MEVAEWARPNGKDVKKAEKKEREAFKQADTAGDKGLVENWPVKKDARKNTVVEKGTMEDWPVKKDVWKGNLAGQATASGSNTVKTEAPKEQRS
jgi:hypothetical protein